MQNITIKFFFIKKSFVHKKIILYYFVNIRNSIIKIQKYNLLVHSTSYILEI